MLTLILLALILAALTIALPRLCPRLLILGAAALLNLGIYDRHGEPGAGYALGMMILQGLGLGFVVVIVLAGALGWAVSGAGPRIPAWLDGLGAALVMTVPAGMLALGLGQALAGSGAPWAMHVTLLTLCGLLTLGGLLIPDPWRGGALGLALWLGLITADSMRFEELLALPPEACLWVDGQDPAAFRPLMALTVPKPVILWQEGSALRWSFRGRAFTRDAGLPRSERACPAPLTLP